MDVQLRRAWLSLLLLPVAFVAAFAVGEGLVVLLGQEPHGEAVPPPWVVLGAFTPAMLVFAVPAALAWRFGHRAVEGGDPRGRWPIVVGVAVTAGFLLLNLASYVVELVG